LQLSRALREKGGVLRLYRFQSISAQVESLLFLGLVPLRNQWSSLGISRRVPSSFPCIELIRFEDSFASRAYTRPYTTFLCRTFIEPTRYIVDTPPTKEICSPLWIPIMDKELTEKNKAWLAFILKTKQE
jgi:hypothetical protein